MWKPSKTAYLLFCIPYLAVGTYLLYLGFTASPNTITYDSYFLKNSFYFEGISCILVPTIIIAGIFLYNKRIGDKDKYLTKNSIKGKAEILDMEQTGTHLNNISQIKFLLKITIPHRSSYQITYKAFVGYQKLNSLYTGAVVPVLVDPKDPENIMLS